MDVFSRTFLPASAAAGVPLLTVSRHIPTFRRCVEPGDPTILVARCLRPDRPLRGEHLLLITRRRVVVTFETRLLHRVRLHLDTPVPELTDVTWTPDPDVAAMEVAATASGGVRERFWIRLADPLRIWQVEALLIRAFRRGRAATAPTVVLPTQRAARHAA
jgi:hypothetical protein